MSERLILKGALAEKRQRRLEIEAEIGGLTHSLKGLILPAAVLPTRDLSAGQIKAQAVRLEELHTEYLKLLADIEAIERDLA